MVCAEEPGDRPRVGGFVEGGFLKTNGEGLDLGGWPQLRHHSHHRAGIDASAQEHAERHITDESQADGLLQPQAQFLGDIRLTPGFRALGEAQVPVSLSGALAFSPSQPMTGWQLVNALKDRMRARNILESEVSAEVLEVQVPRALWVLQQRL